jgi:DTW domain-containing protein YfiP
LNPLLRQTVANQRLLVLKTHDLDDLFPNAVARLRDEREEESTKPYLARGSRAPRCHTCRVIESHCLCRWRPKVKRGVCLLMTQKEVFKPSNTGWLIADVVATTRVYLVAHRNR